MAYFDLHCDTVTECWKTGQGLRQNGLALSLCRGRRLSPWCQTFALFIPDDCRGQGAIDRYESLLALYRREIACNADLVAPCCTRGEILAATLDGRCAALLAVEGGAALNGQVERVDALAADGVKLLTLTWNGDNELACGVRGSGGGLTPVGRAVVRRLAQVGMICDLSHLNERGFWEVAEMDLAPLVATHSDLRSVWEHPRNLTDDQFRAVVASGGVVGLNFYVDFLGPDPFEGIYAHLSRALDLGGEDAVAFGSDYDGAEVAKSLDTVDKTAFLWHYLLDRGVPESILQKLFFTNALRLFGKEEFS